MVCTYSSGDVAHDCGTEMIKISQTTKKKTPTEAVLLNSKAHRVAAELMDNDSAGKGLIVDFNVECPVLAIQSVLLDKVQVVYTSNLQAKEKKSYGLHINIL